MRRILKGVLLLCALVVIAAPVQADEVEDLKRMVQELKKEVAAMRADQALEASSVERAVDDYLTHRAAGEGAGEMAGYMDGKFGLGSADGDFGLTIGGGIVFDLNIYECDGMQDNAFDIQLVRLNFSGHVFENWFFKIQPEFYTYGSALKDAYIQTDLGAMVGGTGNDYFDGLKLRFGQFKMPFSMARLESAYEIDMINRPLIAGALGGSRDVGFQFSNTVMDDAVTYAFAITNGMDSSDEFVYWARAVAAPWTNGDTDAVRNLHFGVSFGTTTGNSGETSGLQSYGGGDYGGVGGPDDSWNLHDTIYPTVDVHGRQLLYGAEVLWFWKQWSVKAEGMYVTQDVDKRPDGMGFSPSDFSQSYGPDDTVDTWGTYFQVAYMITGEDWTEAPSSGLEGVFRFDYVSVDWGDDWSDDVDVDDGDIMAFSLGLNYYFNANVRAMFNYVATDFGDNSARPTESDGTVDGGGIDHNFFLRLQLTF